MRRLSVFLAALSVLMSTWQSVAWAALETRTGIVELRITINNRTNYVGSLKCEGRIRPGYRMLGSSYASAYLDRATTVSLAAGATSVLCVVRIAFNWSGVDVAQLIHASIGLDSYTCSCSTNTFYYSVDIPDFTYPLNGTVRYITAAIDI